MTKQFDNTNSGALFRNDKKEPGSKQPDYTGKINVNGKDLQLAAWLREGSKGKFFSLKVSEFQKKQEERTTYDAIDDEIPF